MTETPSFADLGVRRELVAALARHGIVAPFPIQTSTLPDSLAGRNILGRGRTGSGKTVAFALPIVSRIAEHPTKRRPGHPRALVLVPTRELAVQVNDTIGYLAKAVGAKTMTIYGGVSYNPQIKRLAEGVDVVIATPGRLEDLVGSGHCDLSSVEIAVLDEADLMADMGFLPPVTRLLDATPASGQRMLFSATLDRDVDVVVKKYLDQPVVHSVDSESAGPEMAHHIFLVAKENKEAVLADLLSGAGRSLVFARTKFGAARLAKQLTEAGIPAGELHGNLSQAVRQRNLSAFSDGAVRVLVATDIAARGIHVDDIALVVHADPPAEPKAFLHRSGRTARAGASGIVVTLCLRDQNRKVKELMREAHITATSAVVTPGDPTIAAVRGPVAPAPKRVEIPEPQHFVKKHRKQADERRQHHHDHAYDARSPRGTRPTAAEAPQRPWRERRETTAADGESAPWGRSATGSGTRNTPRQGKGPARPAGKGTARPASDGATWTAGERAGRPFQGNSTRPAKGSAAARPATGGSSRPAAGSTGKPGRTKGAPVASKSAGSRARRGR